MILYYFSNFGKFLIVKSIRIPVLLQLINFLILKPLLTGKAKDALNSLELTSGNYDKAVAILKSRFEDPQVVIQSNIDILLALRQISCTYCKQNHPSNKCSVVNDVQPRNKFLLTKPDILTVYV